MLTTGATLLLLATVVDMVLTAHPPMALHSVTATTYSSSGTSRLFATTMREDSKDCLFNSDASRLVLLCRKSPRTEKLALFQTLPALPCTVADDKSNCQLLQRLMSAGAKLPIVGMTGNAGACTVVEANDSTVRGRGTPSAALHCTNKPLSCTSLTDDPTANAALTVSWMIS